MTLSSKSSLSLEFCQFFNKIIYWTTKTVPALCVLELITYPKYLCALLFNVCHIASPTARLVTLFLIEINYLVVNFTTK